MASRDVPGLGLKAEWDLFETSWKTGMDENLRRLSLLVQLRVLGLVNNLPSEASEGDIYIYRNPSSEFHNHIAVMDLGIWVYYPPLNFGQCIDMSSGSLLIYEPGNAAWNTVLSAEAIKDFYESNADTNAFTDIEKTKLQAIEDNATADMTAAEIKVAYESNTNTNVFTDAEKAKLNNLAASRFLGIYPTLTALRAAHPAPPEGSFAYVDQGPNTDIMSYIWDANDLKYVPQASGNTQETPESIKAKYEANDDTNAFTDAEKSKLAAYDPDAPSIPNGGSTNQVLTKASPADGDAVWRDPAGGVPDGGTTGQVLTKVSNTNGDASWQDPSGGGGGADYPNMIGKAGYALVVNDDQDAVEWRPAASSHERYWLPKSNRWRFVILSNIGNTNTCLRGIEFWDFEGGSRQSIGGIASSSGQDSGTPANYFNGVYTTNTWLKGNNNVWIEYETIEPVSVNFVKLWGQSGQANGWPIQYRIDYHDEVGWVTAWSGITGFTNTGGQIVSHYFPEFKNGEPGLLPDLTHNEGKVLTVNALGNGVFWDDPFHRTPVRTYNGDHTLTVEQDRNKYIRMVNSDDAVLTLPPYITDPFPEGVVVLVRRAGAGNVSIAGEAGVVINTPETLRLRKQGSSATLIKVAENEWDLIGDLEPL